LVPNSEPFRLANVEVNDRKKNLAEAETC